MNCKRKSRRRFFLLVCSRTPPISLEFRGGVEHPKPPLSVRHCLDHPIALVSCPVISISLGLLEKYLASRQFSVDGDVKAVVICQLQTRDADFFYDMIQALVLWEDKYLYVNGEYMEVWCVPSATHVTGIHQSQNQVLGMRVFLTLFLASSVEAC